MELREILQNPEQITAHAFQVVAELAALVSSESPEAQELVLRALEHRPAFNGETAVLDAIIRQLGLFPYLDMESLSAADRIAYEAHRPENMEQDLVFHASQARVYWALRAGENIVLSAPTSFGKSLVIDAIIASGKFKNILVVVPTIALIDETRRRLAQRLRGQFKIITHPFQVPGEKNIYVMTQERVQELNGLDVDFFVIDEFYKLSPDRESENERCARLNEVFYRLVKTGKQFYMLGPNVEGFTPEISARLRFTSIKEEFRTVVTEIHDLSNEQGEPADRLVALCRTLGDPTLIFCSSPSSAGTVARELVSQGINAQTAEAGVPPRRGTFRGE